MSTSKSNNEAPHPPPRWSSFISQMKTRFPTGSWVVHKISRSVPTLSSLGLAIWVNTYIDQQMARESDRIQAFLSQRDRLFEMHREYSQCIKVIEDWSRLHGEDAPKAFKKGVEANENSVVKVNECRSLAKDYWRTAFFALELHKTDASWAKELQSRHDRFVKNVKPIDILDGYKEADKWVYEFPK